MKVDKKVIAASILSGLLNMAAPHAMEAPIDRNKVAQISEKLSEMSLTELDNELWEIFKQKFKANDAELNAALETVKREEESRKFEEEEGIRRGKIIQIMKEMGYQKLSTHTVAEIQSLYKAEHKETIDKDEVMNAWNYKDVFKKVENKDKPVPTTKISENNPFVALGIDNPDLQKRFEEFVKEQGDIYYQKYIDGLDQDPDFMLTGKFVLSDDEKKEITKAYRKMGMKYHPDKNPSPDAQIMFDKARRAYDLLKDVGRFK